MHVGHAVEAAGDGGEQHRAAVRQRARLAGEEVVILPTDGKLIVQTIINLLENAVKHTPESAEVCLSASAKDGMVSISVADTGSGVPDAMKEKIFDRFVMGRSGVADGKRGLGLGLAICRAIVEAHGGKIWVEDNVPHGARFVFTIPMEEVAAS